MCVHAYGLSIGWGDVLGYVGGCSVHEVCVCGGQVSACRCVPVCMCVVYVCKHGVCVQQGQMLQAQTRRISTPNKELVTRSLATLHGHCQGQSLLLAERGQKTCIHPAGAHLGEQCRLTDKLTVASWLFCILQDAGYVSDYQTLNEYVVFLLLFLICPCLLPWNKREGNWKKGKVGK